MILLSDIVYGKRDFDWWTKSGLWGTINSWRDTIIWVSLHAGTLVTSTWEPGNYTSGFIARELGSCVERSFWAWAVPVLVQCGSECANLSYSRWLHGLLCGILEGTALEEECLMRLPWQGVVSVPCPSESTKVCESEHLVELIKALWWTRQVTQSPRIPWGHVSRSVAIRAWAQSLSCFAITGRHWGWGPGTLSLHHEWILRKLPTATAGTKYRWGRGDLKWLKSF